MDTPPCLRVVAEIRRRIATGELAPGDRAPSTRRICQEWDVAMATATKALAVLRQEGLVRTTPRVGTVVAGAEPAPAREPSREHIARAAIAIADSEGLAALSMRGLAAKLDIPTMSLYRYVEGKDDLLLLMADTAFGEERMPAEPHPDWRGRLEESARSQWALYRRHPWLAHVVTVFRPLPLPNVVHHAEWALGALHGLGLYPATMLHVHVVLYGFVQGLAVNLEAEAGAESDSGLTERQWGAAQASAYAVLAASEDYPAFAPVLAAFADGHDLDLDSVFEFGLARLLAGVERLVGAD
ncbi:TetR/AcrR family transcriptional regulator C-terminal domain-containing protein [Saccharopolyspora erythraea]|uniref:TetR/AcrR family transcriptional regulator C-terminal domain-containing protein n=1 Tax=Saccharopolyspora erythraea TaxID=1836 RepID=UPI001BAC7D1E|nr:TetR/AcrR family transcriptional regulator C-terminal domain-containing protein [Saccharopolyspora erythraea]QUH02564.1 TetR/AcrR family transcriptional regulator C-terminal domain-containing protein [Saccharopolyspora erythraea]